MRTSRKKWISWLLPLLILVPSLLFAASGKIKGKVIDAKTGEPVMGANVIVENTTLGAASDLEGEFFIVGIKPGKYNVRASAVGYQTMTYEDVIISIDLTTELEFKLTETALELQPVVVTFKKPEVEIGTTSSITRFEATDISMNPTDDVTAVLLTTPGFKIDEEGKIHIRGGRESEARFIVDGIDSRDPITGEILPINLAAVNIQEIQILTGGMAAEYGDAQSGIVNITTPEGAPDVYDGSIAWSSDLWSKKVFDDYFFAEDRVDMAVGGPFPYTRNFLGRPLTFYFTGNVTLTDTYTPLDISYANEDYLDIGIKVPKKQFNDWSGSMKMAYDVGKGKKVSFYLTRRERQYDAYTSGEGYNSWLYMHDLENRPQVEDSRTSFNIDFTNQISSKTVMNFSFGRQLLNANVSPRGKSPGEFTLVDEIEENYAYGQDQNRNGRLDQDADGDGVVHNGAYDELTPDNEGNNFLDGFYDSNGNYIYEGGGEGYEDLNFNGRWDRGEDWIDLNNNGNYDFAEPWSDRADPETGQNNIGVYDPWDPFKDLNGNGVWDPAEPQLPEQDWNGNGRWDGERFQDANGNGIFDRWEYWIDNNNNGTYDPLIDTFLPAWDKNGNGVPDDGEGYDDQNMNGRMDQRDLIHTGSNGLLEDTPEPFWDGDFYYDTGEPFIDLPDPRTGNYNGHWDPGEPFWDLPSSDGAILYYSVGYGRLPFPTLNGQYDGPNNIFDEYELFTRPNPDPNDRNYPVIYTYNPDLHGSDWVYGDYLTMNENSTWINRTIHDQGEEVFNPPNYEYDIGEERFIDYNGNGYWNGMDLFLNPGRWDGASVWARRRTEEYKLKFSWQSQVHKFHEFKAGTELYYRILKQEYIEGPDQPYTGDAAVNAGEPYPDRGDVRDFWEYRPWQGAVYVQDKMEFEGLIVQAGVRTDFVIHDQHVIDEQKKRYEAGEPGAVIAERGNFQFAPRLGISHPITERSKLYFNYGHFYQTPSFIYYYKSTTTNIDQGTVGNPNLDFEKTVTYELGVHTQVTEDWAFQIAGYYRDIYNLISTVAEKVGPISIYRYVNLDYGRARGLELKVDKNFSNHYQMSLNYDFSYAYGKSSSALSEFERRSLNVPVNFDEHPLDWDETHRVTLNSAVMFQKDEHPVFFGFRLPSYWLLSLQWSFGSGRPYTPSQYTTGMDPNLIPENSERLPWSETTNVKFEKYWDIGNVKTIAGIEVRNLWDKKNINRIYTETGSPIYAVHPLNPDYNPYLDRYEYDANPRNYGPGRQILFKLGFEF